MTGITGASPTGKCHKARSTGGKRVRIPKPTGVATDRTGTEHISGYKYI